MANAIGKPTQGAYLGNDFSAEQDNKGKWKGTETFTAPFGTITTMLPKIGSPNPRPGWGFLLVDSFRIDNVHADVCTVSVQYTGADDFTFDDATKDQFTYELAITSSEEPIETHPKYQKKTGGVPAGELEIISNVKLGMLKRVKAGEYQFQDIHDGTIYKIESALGKELVDFILKGVISYLHARQTWRERYQDDSLPSGTRLNKVGKIDDPRGAPPVSNGRNWLFTGMNTSQEGKIFTIVSEWELSGAEGWYPEIYS